MSTEEQTTTKSIVVTRCSSVFTGQRNGVQFTIYEIEATRADGQVIDVPLRSFEDLALGVVEVTVTRYVSTTHGVSYTLARVNRQRDTDHRFTDIEARLARLEDIAAG